MFNGEEYIMIPKKRLSHAFKTLVRQISESIYRYDPLGLSGFRVPKDEYDGEAMKVAARLRHTESDSNIKEIMLDVVGESFGAEPDAQSAALEKASGEIWTAWQAYLEQTKSA